MLDFQTGPDGAPLRPGQSFVADVIIAGAGAVGLTLGLALAQSGLATVLVGRIDARPLGRTVALLEGSIGLLARLGVWTQLEPHSAKLRIMRLIDDTGSLFKGPPVDFRAAELGRDCFGHNIENADLVLGLAEAAARTPGLRLIDDHLTSFAFDTDRVVAGSESGQSFEGRLLVAADGRASPARQAARIATRLWRYPQAALTTILSHERPHREISTEFHTRSGPFTLVPLPGRPGTPHRSSLVWVMTEAQTRRTLALDRTALARAVERQSRFLLGGVTIADPIGTFPIGGLAASRMTGPRIALAGDAAHAMPPIGAQGLNLGLRDVAALAQCLGAARRIGQDPGATATLERYERVRRRDVALRTIGVDWLNRALLAHSLPVDALRGAGLLALGTFGPLRRLVMREGLMPRGTQ